MTSDDTPPFEVHRYHVDTLTNLLANKSSTTLDVINNKNHSAYFEGYFKELCAKTILVENEYIDRDFLEDYAGYYVRCFKLYSRRCTRLHFFNIDFNCKDIDGLLTKKDNSLSEKVLESAYLGFIIVKPLPQTTIGRTCLKTYATENTQRVFPIIRKYKVHLFGITLKLKSLSYQQQDSVVAACATSALWSAFHQTGTLFHHNIPSPLEITKAATRNLPKMTRIFPNVNGLDINQMANAIRSVGLEPFTLNVENNSYDLKNTLYAYLRGKIPLILIIYLVDVSGQKKKRLGLHAVVISGYNFGLKEAIPYETGHFLNKATCINKIYVHDDQVGPFARMVFDNKQILMENGSFDSLSTFFRGNNVRAIPQQILIPLYHKIRIPLTVIHNEVVKLDEFFELYRKHQIFPLPKRQEWDIQLITVCDLKEELFNSPKHGEYLKNILSKTMPRFLWRATISCDNEKIIDFLFDATDIEQGTHFIMAIKYEDVISAILRALFKGIPVGTYPEIREIHKWFEEN